MISKTLAADNSQDRRRFVRFIKVKITNDVHSKLMEHFNGDTNEVEAFLSRFCPVYLSKNRTFEGSLDEVERALNELKEELNKSMIKDENKEDKLRNGERMREIYGDKENMNHKDKSTTLNQKLLGRIDDDDDNQMNVDLKDDEERVIKNAEMISSNSNDDDDMHSGEKRKTDGNEDSKKKIGEKDDDYDDNINGFSDDRDASMAVDDYDDYGDSRKNGKESKPNEKYKEAKYPFQKESDDSRGFQKSSDAHVDGHKKWEDGLMDENSSQSGAWLQTLNLNTQASLDRSSLQSGSLENFPNSGNEFYGSEKFQLSDDIVKTYKSYKPSSPEYSPNLEPFSFPEEPFNATSSFLRKQQDSQQNEPLGILKHSKVNKVSQMQVHEDSNSSTDSDNYDIIHKSGNEVDVNNQSITTPRSSSLSEESTLKNVESGLGKVRPTSSVKISKSREFAFMESILKKSNKDKETLFGKTVKDPTNEFGVAGIHRRVPPKPVSQRFNADRSRSPHSDNEMNASGVDNKPEFFRSLAGIGTDQPHSSGSGLTWERGSYPEGEFKSKTGSTEILMFPIDVNFDVDPLNDLIQSENKLESVQIKLYQANGNVTCEVSGGSEVERIKTKGWLEGLIKDNVSGIGNRFNQSGKFAFEKSLCLLENVLCFAEERHEGCFIALRYFTSKLTKKSYSHLHFNYLTREIMIFFVGNKAKLDAEKVKSDFEKDVKIFKYSLTDTLTIKMIAKASNMSPDVFVEFIDDQNYLVVGDNSKLMERVKKPPRTISKSFSLSRNEPPKFASLKVDIVNKELSKADANSFVVFWDSDKTVSLSRSCFRDWTRNSSAVKLTHGVEVLNKECSRKKVYLVSISAFQVHQSAKETLKDLYSVALYHASDGSETLALTLAMTTNCTLADSVDALHEVIKNYDLGKRVHDNLKTITIAAKDDRPCKALKECFK